MQKLQYEPKVTLGNIISILCIFGSCAAAYAAIVSKDNEHDIRINYNSKAVEEIKTELKDINKTLNSINSNIILLNQSQRVPSNAFTNPNTR